MPFLNSFACTDYSYVDAYILYKKLQGLTPVIPQKTYREARLLGKTRSKKSHIVAVTQYIFV